jgi:hypothetical protein
VQSRKVKKRNQRNSPVQAGAQLGEQANWVSMNTRMKSFPDRMITTLQYFEAPSPGLNGISSWGVRFRATSPFDPSFAGSLQAKGFAEFASIYASYRVLKSKIKVIYAPILNTDSVSVTVLPLNADPGALPSAATIIGWPTNPYSLTKVAGAGGSPAIELTNTMTTAKMFGSEMVNVDDNFSALTSADPNNNFFWGIGLYGNITYANNGGLVFVYIDFDVQFFDRKILA